MIEFDDTYIGVTVGKKRGRCTEKVKIFVVLSLDEADNTKYLKIHITENIQQKSIKDFAESDFSSSAEVKSDEYRSYVLALANFKRTHRVYIP